MFHHQYQILKVRARFCHFTYINFKFLPDFFLDRVSNIKEDRSENYTHESLNEAGIIFPKMDIINNLLDSVNDSLGIRIDDVVLDIISEFVNNTPPYSADYLIQHGIFSLFEYILLNPVNQHLECIIFTLNTIILNCSQVSIASFFPQSLACLGFNFITNDERYIGCCCGLITSLLYSCSECSVFLEEHGIMLSIMETEENLYKDLEFQLELTVLENHYSSIAACWDAISGFIKCNPNNVSNKYSPMFYCKISNYLNIFVNQEVCISILICLENLFLDSDSLLYFLESEYLTQIISILLSLIMKNNESIVSSALSLIEYIILFNMQPSFLNELFQSLFILLDNSNDKVLNSILSILLSLVIGESVQYFLDYQIIGKLAVILSCLTFENKEQVVKILCNIIPLLSLNDSIHILNNPIIFNSFIEFLNARNSKSSTLIIGVLEFLFEHIDENSELALRMMECFPFDNQILQIEEMNDYIQV